MEPRGRYRSVVRSGATLYLSGQVSRLGDKVITGPAGEDQEQMRFAARVAALRALSALDAKLAEGERIRLLKLTGDVMAAPAFSGHSAALDAASEIFLSVLGEDCGSHSRTAIGVASLPGTGMIELDLICAVERME